MVKKTHKVSTKSKDSQSIATKRTSAQALQPDLDLSQTFSDVFTFFKKYQSIIIPILFISIAVFLSAFFRVYPAYLPATDDFAMNSIQAQIRSGIEQSVRADYPQLPQDKIAQLVNTEYANYMNTYGDQIALQSDALSQQFKSAFQDDDGQTYLIAIDPYTWYRQARNLVEKGQYGDEFRNGVDWNNHMVAPNGNPAGPSFHPWIIATLYGLVSLFNPTISLMTVAFYIPVLFSALSIIPAYFIARRFAGNVGGFFAAMLLAVHISFLTRTVGGFSDTDAYNVFFPLLIGWLFLEAFEASSLKKKLTLSALSGFSVGVFSFAWGGWWYVFDFVLATLGLYVLYVIISNYKFLLTDFTKAFVTTRLHNTLYTSLVFLSTSVVSVTLFKNFSSFTSGLLAPFGFTQIKDVGLTSVWPNVYTTVAELNSASFTQIIGQMGGQFFFIIALIGIVLPLLMKKGEELDVKPFGLAVLWYAFIWVLLGKVSTLIFLLLLALPLVAILGYLIYTKETVDVKYGIFLMIWLLATLYAATKGVRFTLLMVPVFSVAFGVTIGIAYRLFSEKLAQLLDIKKAIVSVIIFSLFFIILIAPINQAHTVAKSELPSMNDAWFGTLTKIKENSEPNAIINSWWDFGHWFKAIADRPVTFDGASQNTPMAHWIGKVLLTDDEKLAVGILRMLDCGSNDAFEVLFDYEKDHPKTVDMLYDIVVLDKVDAQKYLSRAEVPDSVASHVIEKTHCMPPEDFFITSQDMVGKSGVWAHFGSWDFDKALMVNKVRNQPQQQGVDILVNDFGVAQDDALRMYFEIKNSDPDQWIAPWPSYATGLSACTPLNELLHCGAVVVNTTSNHAYANLQQGTMLLNSYTIMNDGEFTQYDIEEGSNELAAFLVNDGTRYHAALAQPPLQASMFTRMFFMEGQGLEHFEKFDDVRDVTGARIITWKVKWPQE